MVKFSKFQASLVKLTGSSFIDSLIGEIVNFVKESVSNISPDKIDPSLLRFICNVIENSYTKKDVTIKLIKRKLL